MKLFRKKIKYEIVDEKNFLVSLIPFLRGYANILGNKRKYKLLSKVMHGYENSKINLTNIYKVLLLKKDKVLNKKIFVSVEDIINIDLDNIEILKENNYPLLNKTLKHSLVYLVLRLLVEKKLCERFTFTHMDNMGLGDIISKSLVNNDDLRIFFTSRKTLLNEFNHFEGNMNLFQPAIDISEKVLHNEIKLIKDKLDNI